MGMTLFVPSIKATKADLADPMNMRDNENNGRKYTELAGKIFLN